MDLTRDIDLNRLLPAVTDKSKDIISVMDAENIEFNALWLALCDILKNGFISTAADYGLTQWESILDIVPKVDDSLDDRRFRILTYLKGNRPYTYEKLCEMLDELCGADGYKLDLDTNAYSIVVKVNLGVKSQRDSVAELMERIVPKNLLLTVTLNYNRHIDLKAKFTHGAMRAYTHKSLREDVL